MAFDGRSVRLDRRVEESDFLRSRDILIISCNMSIFSLCLAWIDTMAVATAEGDMLDIEGYMAGFIISDGI